MEKIFSKDDWCFFEFKLVQVREVKDGCVQSVVDGKFQHSGLDLSDRCYPMELSIKAISDSVAFYYDELHKIKSLNLNYPDLNREYIRRWVELCDNRKDECKMKRLWESLRNFHQGIIETVNQTKQTEIEGVQIFR